MEINVKDILYTDKINESGVISFDNNDYLDGSVKVKQLESFIVTLYDLKIKQDFQMGYEHDNNGVLFEYVIDAKDVSHTTSNGKLEVRSGTTNIYREKACSDISGTKKTIFKKNGYYKSFGIKPKNNFLETMIKKYSEFETIFKEDIDEQNEYLVARNIVDIGLSKIANDLLILFKKEMFLEELGQAYCVSFFINALDLKDYDVEIISKIKNIIKHMLPQKVTLENVSKELDISKRTLSSICKENGRSFTQIKKDTFLQEHKKLTNSGLCEDEVARYLGYSSSRYMKISLDFDNSKKG